MAMSVPLLLAALVSAALMLSAGIAALLCHRRRRCGAIGAADPEMGAETSSDGGDQAVRSYTWKDIEQMTEGFTMEVVGEGGYSTVYLARLRDGALAAVKVYRQGESEMLHRAFEKEVEVLLRVRRHRNVVRLLGFSHSQITDEGALVFEYVPNGTLHEKLHGCSSSAPPLPWARRLSIAHQIATALEHLHESCDLPVIHGDVKPSNILLDDRLHAKLCDFGSAKLGFSSAVRPAPVVGSPGYLDPHYLRTGVPSKKNDVYSFGVVLLEMVTGTEAFCEAGGSLLTSAMVGALGEEGRVGELLDARVAGECGSGDAAEVAALVRRCVGEGVRPTMGEVARELAGMVRKEDEGIGDVGGKING